MKQRKRTWMFLYACIYLMQMVQAQTGVEVFNDTTNTSQDTSLLCDSTFNDSIPLPWPMNIQKRLDQITRSPLLETSQAGIIVWDLDADSVIYKFNERQLMRPASTMKVLTAVAALDLLGGSHQINTHIKYTGRIDNRTLNGNIYCIGGFDPKFDAEDMEACLAAIKGLGIDTIRGDIYADLSMKTPELLGEGWCWDDKNPTLTPLLYNGKDQFLQQFEQTLREGKITLYSELKEGNTPADAKILCTRSHALWQVLDRMMKESDNLYAEAVFYQIAAAKGIKPAKNSNARSNINQFVQKLGLNPSNYRIADGSGLSLYNYLTPELLVQTLRYAAQNTAVHSYLNASLPLASVDGTLKNRMRKTAASQNVRAKTGTVTGIVSLAGYCTAANGRRLCFAIINQGLIRAAKGRQFQDWVCRALCEP